MCLGMTSRLLRTKTHHVTPVFKQKESLVLIFCAVLAKKKKETTRASTRLPMQLKNYVYRLSIAYMAENKQCTWFEVKMEQENFPRVFSPLSSSTREEIFFQEEVVAAVNL